MKRNNGTICFKNNYKEKERMNREKRVNAIQTSRIEELNKYQK